MWAFEDQSDGRRMCKLLDIALGSYYHHRNQTSPTVNSLPENERGLKRRLIALFSRHSGNYGASRLVNALEREGFAVADHMEANLVEKTLKAGLRQRRPP